MITNRNRTLAVVLAVLVAGCGDGDSGARPSPVTIELSPSTIGLPGTAAATTTATTTTTSTTTTTTIATTTTAPRTASLVEEIGPRVGDDGTFRPGSTSYDRVVDATRRVTVRLPEVWAERSTEPGRLDDGGAAPYVAASTDLTAFLDGYDTAGLTLVVLPPASDPAAALDGYRFAADCGGGRSSPFEVDGLTGEYQVWTDCAGTGTDIITLAAMPADESFTAVVLVQVLTDFDVDVLDEVLSSLEVRAS